MYQAAASDSFEDDEAQGLLGIQSLSKPSGSKSLSPNLSLNNERPTTSSATEHDTSFNSQLNVVAGVIKEGETNHMAKLIFRLSRGKVATFFENIGTVASLDGDEQNNRQKTGQV